MALLEAAHPHRLRPVHPRTLSVRRSARRRHLECSVRAAGAVRDGALPARQRVHHRAQPALRHPHRPRQQAHPAPRLRRDVAGRWRSHGAALPRRRPRPRLGLPTAVQPGAARDAVRLGPPRHRLLLPTSSPQAFSPLGLALHHVGARRTHQLGLLCARGGGVRRVGVDGGAAGLALRRPGRLLHTVRHRHRPRQRRARRARRRAVRHPILLCPRRPGAGPLARDRSARRYARGGGRRTRRRLRLGGKGGCVARECAPRSCRRRGGVRGAGRGARVRCGGADRRAVGVRLLHEAVEAVLRLVRLPALCAIEGSPCLERGSNRLRLPLRGMIGLVPGT
mmetsp:Transcript_16404/g.52613  ORF Transcript_16404/g.52613 Transcript_16404/m.52613 type:complete len:337 (+) Transcript_16404:238-1248(+)